MKAILGKKIIFFCLLAFLFIRDTSFAEADSYDHVKLFAGLDGVALSAGFSQWTSWSINFHQDLTYINSSEIGNAVGIDLSAGISIINVGIVAGYTNGNDHNTDPHMIAAIYPEIQILQTGPHRDVFEFGIRHYITSDGTHLTTIGIGISWGK